MILFMNKPNINLYKNPDYHITSSFLYFKYGVEFFVVLKLLISGMYLDLKFDFCVRKNISCRLCFICITGKKFISVKLG